MIIFYLLRYPNLRCLNLGKVGKYLVYLPLELSETHLAHQKNLTPVQTSQVILKTAVPCFDRQNNIAKMIEKANINDSPLLKYNEVSTQLHMSRFIGKVLAADLLDTDKFQNHFLLTAASLGTQLLKTYDLGVDSKGQLAELTLDKIRNFFFEILNGKIEIQHINGKFDISQITGRFS